MFWEYTEEIILSTYLFVPTVSSKRSSPCTWSALLQRWQRCRQQLATAKATLLVAAASDCTSASSATRRSSCRRRSVTTRTLTRRSGGAPGRNPYVYDDTAAAAAVRALSGGGRERQRCRLKHSHFRGGSTATYAPRLKMTTSTSAAATACRAAGRKCSSDAPLFSLPRMPYVYYTPIRYLHTYICTGSVGIHTRLHHRPFSQCVHTSIIGPSTHHVAHWPGFCRLLKCVAYTVYYSPHTPLKGLII
jgi:hypothetical protein